MAISLSAMPASEQAVFIDILGSAPIEISEMIVRYFDPLDVICLARVSKTWMCILQSDRVNLGAFRQLSGHFKCQQRNQIGSTPTGTPRELFRRFLRKEHGWFK